MFEFCFGHVKITYIHIAQVLLFALMCNITIFFNDFSLYKSILTLNLTGGQAVNLGGPVPIQAHP